MRASAMSGLLSATTMLSETTQLVRNLIRVQVDHGDLEVAERVHELQLAHPCDLGPLAERDAAEFVKLDREQKSELAFELLGILAGAQEEVVVVGDRGGMHGR